MKTGGRKALFFKNTVYISITGIVGTYAGILIKRTDWVYVKFKIFLIWLSVRKYILLHPYSAVTLLSISLLTLFWIVLKRIRKRDVLTLRIKYERPGAKSRFQHKLQYSLEELSVLWKGDSGNKKQPVIAEIKKESCMFASVILNDFFFSEVLNKPFIDKKSFDVITSLLSVLDKEGNCPSVVNNFGDPERDLPADSYRTLARVTLTEHSVLTAQKILSIADSPPMRGKLIITALGHDIGKIPSCRRAGKYAMGDHPMSSVILLNSIPGFSELQFSREIEEGVKNHHRRAANNLCEYLKEADSMAREIEMLRFSEENVLQDNHQVKCNDNTNEIQNLEQPGCNSEQAETRPMVERQSQDNANVNSKGYGEEQDDIPPESQPDDNNQAETSNGSRKNMVNKKVETDCQGGKVKIRFREKKIPWFDEKEFIELLRPYINRFEGKTWKAVSMRNGVVYFQVEPLWLGIKKLAALHKSRSVLMGDADQSIRQDYLYTVVKRLREKGMIAGLIQKEYFGGYFSVHTSDGKQCNAYFTPFNAEAFADSVSELEELKQGSLKEIIKIEPDYKSG